jgi:predicted 2-oxoglutarate/Fe(II)-dependent dioxygenase YbiX
MSSTTTALATILRAVRRPGDFYAFGTTVLPTPSLEVEGVGPIALPLLPIQAKQLIAVAQRAPYGRGQDTVVDTQVRRTWQIGADRVRIGGKRWPSTLDDIVARAADGLGVTDPVNAELYKLLIYDEGCFFVGHRDTEKTPGMFATLIVVLPSQSSGGELVVRHHDREVQLDLRCDDPSEATFAAFYADCLHEVLPVTAGYRLTLVYNLLRRGKGAVPEAPRYDREQSRVEGLLRSWSAAESGSDDDNPTKLIYTLEHAYTPAELGFATLKGADAAAAGVLVGAAARAGCDLHLALLTIEESGPAEYTGYHGRRRGRWSDDSADADNDEFDVVEISDRDVTLSDWRRPDGAPSTLSSLPADTESELSPPDALEDAEPDEQHFHEATGNEGASFERTYRHAAFVLWPSRRVLAVLNQGGLQLTLPYLTELTERWSTCAEDERSAQWSQAHELAGHMLSTWPRHPAYGRQDEAVSDATRLLTLLTRLGDADRIDDFLADIAASGLCGTADTTAILAGLALLAPGPTVALIELIIKGTAPTSLGMCGDLLARAGAALPQVDPVALRPAATILLDALPGDPARATPYPVWQYGPRLSTDFIVDLLVAFGRIDPALAMRAADHMLAWPKTYTLDGLLVPAIRKLMGSATMQTLAARRLRAACLDHLQVRAAETLEAPRDWRRANSLGCQCPHCLLLSQYLAHPAQKEWVLRAAAPQRAHVESTIKAAGCDLDMTTVRRGSPHSLVCTKNQASYERRVKQRTDDLANIERLEG